MVKRETVLWVVAMAMMLGLGVAAGYAAVAAVMWMFLQPIRTVLLTLSEVPL